MPSIRKTRDDNWERPLTAKVVIFNRNFKQNQSNQTNQISFMNQTNSTTGGVLQGHGLPPIDTTVNNNNTRSVTNQNISHLNDIYKPTNSKKISKTFRLQAIGSAT